ncbi:MAG: coniferyl aldehyde dehydrogenase [Acidobacteriota bacterium]
MSIAEATPVDSTRVQEMQEALDLQKEAFRNQGPPSYNQRIDRIDRVVALLVDHQQDIVDALDADFGHRSAEQTLLADVAGSIESLKHAKKNLRSWMRPEKRSVQFPLGVFGARAHIQYEPLGTVGIISPWNFPVNLAISPLAGIFAAGNSALLKPSELTPATSALLADMLNSAYDAEELRVFTGGPDVAGAFSGLPFDHLLFTGSTGIARKVMAAAAPNLVPVTLELGGKSPVVVGRTADLQKASDRILAGKTLNAGQICLAPDYLLVPDGEESAFVEAAKQSVSKMYKTLRDNPDYSSVINERHYERLQSLLDDAADAGAEIVELNPAQESFDKQEATHKMPPTLVLGATSEMRVMQEEIFGPVLPVLSYKHVKEAIAHINGGPRPLAVYYFGNDSAEQTRLLDQTTSGGVTVNDVIMHVSMEDLPFGGVGPSGMGRYHGVDGFKNFSNAKAVYSQTKSEVANMLRPPYGRRIRNLLSKQISK